MTASSPPRRSAKLVKDLRGAAWLSALVLLGPAVIVLVGMAPSAEAATTRSLAITAATARPTVPFGAFDGNAPKVFDVDGDGDKEIVAQNDNQWVYVFDSRTGGLLAEMKTAFPAGWGARSMNAPEMAVLSNGGQPKLIVANSAAVITSYSYDSLGSTATKLLFRKDWERRLTDCHSNPGMDSKPVLADLDKDGRLEILAATEELGVYALRDNGAVYWKKCIGGGNGEPTVGDLNQDSWPDVVFGSDGGIVTAMNGRTGATMWSFNLLSRFNLGSGSMPVGVAVAQLDGAGGLEVVGGARDSHDATNLANNHALLFALTPTGGLLWGRQDTSGGNPLTYTHPIVVDADGSGSREIYWADWNTMGHKPGNWEVTGPANFYRYDNAGNRVWKTSLATFWNNKDLALADVDGDGAQEVLANGPGGNGHDGIWYLSAGNGAKETFIDTYPYKVNRGAVVADLHGNGRMQWIVQVASFATGGAHGLLVYDTGVGYSSAWPHMPYVSQPRGSGGTATTTQPPATTPPGTFDATFSAVRGNEWWVQASVSGNGHAVAKVDVSLNGGAWQPVAKQSWGWGSSYHIAQGTTVQLRATSGTGATDLSACYRWIPPSNTDAAQVACTGATATSTTTSSSSTSTTGLPGAFDASFSVPSSVNEWWVEVAVTANGQVAKVEAQVNGGSWVLLPKQGWGNWAKSFHVPAGSQVVFRATDSLGQSDTSATFTWLDGSSGGGSGTFAATFTPKSVGNDWWVEVDVGANQPLAKVEARVGSGAWFDLAKQSWGSWAKSTGTAVPNGAQVTFRATGTGGGVATSQPVTWT